MNSLLPENYQKTFRTEKILRLCFWVVAYFSFVFAFGTAFLSPSYFSLKFSLNDTLRRLDTETISVERRNANSLEKEISSLNAMLRDYNRNGLKEFSFSSILESFLNATPAGIKINGIDFDKNQDGVFFVRLSGEASLRADIIAYEKALKNLKEVSAVRSPISNLLKDEKAPFIIEADIKKEFYEQK